MKTLLLKNSDVVVPGEKLKNAAVLIEGAKIARVAPESERENIKADEEIDLFGKTLYPGFIDIHIHGAAGVDVMAADLDALIRMAEFLAKNGVTRWLPTFVPDAEENYRKAITVIDEFMKWQTGKAAAQIAGVHYEGPFVSEKQCGALHPHFFRNFETGEELSSLPTPASDNAKKIMTVAPEVSGGIELIKELHRSGWVISLGHTRADVRTLDAAFAAGARHMTHFFNAMSGLHHRDIGAVGWGLITEEMTCDVIADGIHVHPEMLKFLYQAKTSARLSLISDAILPAGLGDGEYDVWGEKITVENGRTSNELGRLAGSVITMHEAVRLMLSLGISDVEVSRMASANPAQVLGIDRHYGSIEAGKYADLMALDEEGKVTLTVIEGRVL